MEGIAQTIALFPEHLHKWIAFGQSLFMLLILVKLPVVKRY